MACVIPALAQETAGEPSVEERPAGEPQPAATEVPQPIEEEEEERPEDAGAAPDATPEAARDPDRRSVRYRIRATVEGPDIRGEARIEIDPVGAASLDDVVLVLFPNILQERLAGEDSRSYYTIHPRRFRSGGMQITSLTSGTGEALPWTGVDVSRPDGRGGVVLFPQGTAIRATLPEAAAGTVTVIASFEVHVPERFGTFSWYEDDLFLTGGWYPLVAPRLPSGEWDLTGDFPRADATVEVDVAADHWAMVGSSLTAPEPGEHGRRVTRGEVHDRPHVLLLVADALYVKQGEGVRVLQAEKAVRQARRIRDTAEEARAFLADSHVLVAGTGGAPAETLLYEAPLTRELAFHDAPVALASFRNYRVFPFLRRYHDVHVARAAMAVALRDRIYELEPGDDASWALDAAVWYLALRFQAKTHEGMRDVRDYARPFSFIPAVDLVLNTPDFPFAAEYYDNFYFTDLVRDDVSRFNNLRPNGRVAYEKLVDLLGPDRAAAVMDAYLAGTPADGGFRAVASRVTGQDLTWFFEQWRRPLPRVNYQLEKLLVAQSANGEWVSQVRLERSGESVREPVEVRARVKGPDAHETWQAEEGSSIIELYTREKPQAIELDWRSRLFETNRRDNRWPPKWRMLLQYAWVDYEFKLNTLDAAAGFQFERSNDLRDEIDVGAFHMQQSRGAQLGYVHSAGQPTFYRGLLHRFGALVLVEDLAEGFGRKGRQVVPGFDPAVSKVDATVGVNAFYRYDSRDDWRFSRFGTRLYLGVEVGTSIKGPASQYQLAEGELVHLRKLTDNNVVALQLKGGTFFLTDPASVPLSKLFYLGGIDDVRGISAPEIVGPTKFVATLEWRHFLLHDLDVNLWLERMRSLQGALFVDTGYISARTEDVPAFRHWVTDVGYGFRQHYDLFGIRPMVFRVDIAQRVDNLRATRESDVRFYIGAGQSF